MGQRLARAGTRCAARRLLPEVRHHAAQAGATAFQAAGHGLEIVPLSHPSKLRREQLLAVRVLSKGQPVANAAVIGDFIGNTSGPRVKTDKWTIMVVGGLSKGPVRFNALLRLIDGVSHRMLTLTLTLRGLEQDGLVKRTVYPTVPPKVEYELTAVGRSLIEPLSTLSSWAQKYLPAIEAARAANEEEASTPGD